MAGFFDGHAALTGSEEARESYLKVKNSLTREILESPEYRQMYNNLIKELGSITDYSNKDVKNPELAAVAKMEEPAKTILLFYDFRPIGKNEVLHALHPFACEKDRKAIADRCRRLMEKSKYK